MIHHEICVLVSPLDWGLGHATRCIPVIRELLSRKVRVIIGGSGKSITLLKREFPDLLAVEIPSPEIKYPADGNMAVAMLKQLPVILNTIKEDHKALNRLVSKHRITHVISDNRYGLYHRGIRTALICHQLKIRFPKIAGLLKMPLNRYHAGMINKFDTLWIPDFKEPHSLSGTLSMTDGIQIPFVHTGPLSRFNNIERENDPQLIYHQIALLSGPEPQRSILELIIKKHFIQSGKQSLIIKGIQFHKSTEANVTIMGMVEDSYLRTILHPETVLYCRSGYSTIMDLAALKHHRIIFIPTPGQTEQEYLAKYHHDHFNIPFVRQGDLLPLEVSAAKPLPFSNDSNDLGFAIEHFLS